MGKIIGRIFFVIALAISACNLHAQITLKAYDMQGDALVDNSIGMGQPFMLEVAVDGFSSLHGQPTIKGIEKFYLRNPNVMSVAINGKSTIKYTYKARIDTQGVYTVGPATIVENNQTFASNSLSIKVVEPSAISARLDKKNGQSNIAFLRLTTDKKNVVQGEKITCILRFYYTDDVVNIEPITQPEIPGLHFENATNNKGNETINGVEYHYFDFMWAAQASQIGKIVIPAYAMDFSVRSQSSQNTPWALFFGHTTVEHKRVYSNPISIDVAPLPPYNGVMHAIGSFNHFTARIEPAVAKEGEGMILTLEIEGDGVFDKQHNITLSGMPDALKYYESKEYIKTKNNPKEPTKNCWEFVVQGIRKGDVQIPRQAFTFFDIASRTYKTLHSLPLSIMILPSNKPSKQFSKPNDPIDEPVISTQVNNNEIAPIARVRPAMMMHDIQQLPWWLFFLLIIVACLILFSDVLIKTYDMLSIYFLKKTTKKNVFKKARSAITQAAHTHHYETFNAIFIGLFAVRCDVDKRLVNEAFMRERLISCGMDDTELTQWDHFIWQLTELVFFRKEISIKEGQKLVSAAYHWIDRLEELL